MSGYGRAAIVAAVMIAGAAVAEDRGPPPVAVYWMSAQTASGMMAAISGAGGGRPSSAAMMSMMMHGGPDPNAVIHTLRLQLGSVRRPQGDPQAEHDPDAALDVGPVLPLVTPIQAAQPSQPTDETPQPPPQYQKPKGRMLIYWGCGEHAGPGQPFVVDFSTISNDPQTMAGLMRGMAITPMQPPSPGRYATYGEWPNARSQVTIPSNSSLVGPHLVKGNYSPDMNFTLGPSQDFMAPLQLIRNQRTPTGSVQLAWNPIPTALGYFASVIGQGSDQTTVMWSSSAERAFAFGQPDYLAPYETRRLVANGHLLSPQQSQCLVPEEVVQNIGRGGILQMSAYGDEANFGGPKPLHPEWVVKLRYRAATSALLGQAGPGGGRDNQQPQNHGPGSILKGLGGIGGFIH
jgi:hypothetical protein